MFGTLFRVACTKGAHPGAAHLSPLMMIYNILLLWAALSCSPVASQWIRERTRGGLNLVRFPQIQNNFLAKLLSLTQLHIIMSAHLPAQCCATVTVVCACGLITEICRLICPPVSGLCLFRWPSDDIMKCPGVAKRTKRGKEVEKRMKTAVVFRILSVKEMKLKRHSL